MRTAAFEHTAEVAVVDEDIQHHDLAAAVDADEAAQISAERWAGMVESYLHQQDGPTNYANCERSRYRCGICHPRCH